MRKTLHFLVTFLSMSALNCSGQSLFVSKETGKITFEKIMEVEGMSADVIFDKTKVWFVQYFRNANEVIRGEVKPSLIKGTFVTEYAAILGAKQAYENDIQVRIKDGAVKVIIDNLVVSTPSQFGSIEEIGTKMDGVTLRPSYNKTWRDIESQSQSLCENLLNHLQQKDADW